MSDGDIWGTRAFHPSPGPDNTIGEGDFWGARAVYADPAPFEGFPSTPLPEESVLAIDKIYVQIMAQHPEQISLLADHWQNAYDLLDEISIHLRARAEELAERDWDSPEARNEFMRRGPGQVLADLEGWKNAAIQNRDALTALASLAAESRREMEDLWRRYNDAVAAELQQLATHPILLTTPLRHTPLRHVIPSVWDVVMDNIRERRDDFTRQARVLVHRVAQEYIHTVGNRITGVGPMTEAVNAVVNPTLAVPLPPMPGAPPPPPGRPPVTAPPVTTPPGTTPSGTTPPPGTTLPGTTPPGTPPGTTAPGTPPLPGTAPPGSDLGPLPGGASGIPPGSAVSRVPAATAGSLLPQGSFPPMLPPPSMPPGSTLRRPERRASGGKEPAPALQSPLLPPPPAGTPTQPGNVPERQDQRVQGTTPTEEPFAVPPGVATTPVLSGPRPQRPSPAPSAGSPASLLPPGASPPVLGAPSRPAQPSIADRERSRRARLRRALGDNDWLGLDALRASTTGGVVDAPSGDAAPDDAPVALRARRHASIDAVHAVLAEIARRRAAATTAPATESEGPAIIDDTAFVVESPGGGVVGKGSPEPGHRAEPPPALGAR